MTRPQAWPLRAAAGLSLGLVLVACQGPAGGGGSPAIVLTTAAPVNRALIAGRGATPTPPAETPTPVPTPPPDVTPPQPAGTPIPVPSRTPPGGNVGGPTPQPLPTGTPGLSLAAGEQPVDTWQAGPTMRRPRAGLVGGVVQSTLIAAEGAPTPTVELLPLAEGMGGAWRLFEKHDPRLGFGTTIPAGVSLMAGGQDANALYAAGGSDGGLSGAVLRYGSEGFVDRVATLVPAVQAGAGGMIGDTMVVAGGIDAAGPTNVVQRLKIQLGTVDTGASLPVATAGAAGVVFDGQLWVLGGFTVDRFGVVQLRDGVAVYDLAKNQWRDSDDGLADPPPKLPEARHSAAACVLDGQLYLAGGAGAGGGVLGSLLVLDRTQQPPRWRALAAMPTPRALLALVPGRGKLWAIGGRGADGQASATVEVYAP